MTLGNSQGKGRRKSQGNSEKTHIQNRMIRTEKEKTCGCKQSEKCRWRHGTIIVMMAMLILLRENQSQDILCAPDHHTDPIQAGEASDGC